MKRKLTTEISTRKLNEMKQQTTLLESHTRALEVEAVELRKRITDSAIEVSFWQNATWKALNQLLTGPMIV